MQVAPRQRVSAVNLTFVNRVLFHAICARATDLVIVQIHFSLILRTGALVQVAQKFRDPATEVNRGDAARQTVAIGVLRTVERAAQP